MQRTHLGAAAVAVAAMVVCTGVATHPAGAADPPLTGDTAARNLTTPAVVTQLAGLDFGVDSPDIDAASDSHGWLEIVYEDLAVAEVYAMPQVPAPAAALIGLSMLAALAASRRR